jgi:hypothetical protein
MSGTDDDGHAERGYYTAVPLASDATLSRPTSGNRQQQTSKPAHAHYVTVT